MHLRLGGMNSIPPLLLLSLPNPNTLTGPAIPRQIYTSVPPPSPNITLSEALDERSDFKPNSCPISFLTTQLASEQAANANALRKQLSISAAS